MSPAEFKRFLKQGAEHAGPGSRMAQMHATFGKKVKSAVAKKMSRGSALKFMLGKSDADWKGSASERAIFGKGGKVKKSIDR